MKRVILITVLICSCCIWAVAGDTTDNDSLLNAVGKNRHDKQASGISAKERVHNDSNETLEVTAAEPDKATPETEDEDESIQFVKSPVVYIGTYSIKYHKGSCRYKDSDSEPVSRDEAIEKGYKPCGICKP